MSPAPKIRVGIGGWVFPPWRGVFYPPGLTQARELSHRMNPRFREYARLVRLDGAFGGAQVSSDLLVELSEEKVT